MKHTVFFSWQDDTDVTGDRTFIEKALTKAIKQLARDLTIDKAIREGLSVDKDTRGVAGTPPIVDTIFRKIDEAAAFLADVTFVGKRRDGRPTPNPNVLLEYGWALRSRGYGRIICVMNTAYGEPNDQTLPFNMKHLRRPITYLLPESADSEMRQTVLSDLADDLDTALKAIVQSEEFRVAAAPPPRPEPSKFQPAPALDGLARFRKRGDPLGLMELGVNRFLGQRGTPVVLAEGSALWLRVMPEERLSRQWTVVQLRDVMSRAETMIHPIGFATSWAYVRSGDGFGYVAHPPENNTQVSAVSFAFRSGEVWTVYAGPLGRSAQDTFVNIEKMVTECFLETVRFMRKGLAIALPCRWIAGIDGIKGKRMQHFAPPGRSYVSPYTAECLEDVVSDTGLLKDSDEVRLALKPFFEKLYDACGEERGDYMDTPLLNLQA
jgi:hypothetical protein